MRTHTKAVSEVECSKGNQLQEIIPGEGWWQMLLSKAPGSRFARMKSLGRCCLQIQGGSLCEKSLSQLKMLRQFRMLHCLARS